MACFAEHQKAACPSRVSRNIFHVDWSAFRSLVFQG